MFAKGRACNKLKTVQQSVSSSGFQPQIAALTEILMCPAL